MMIEEEIDAIERRVLETPEGRPLTDFGRAPVLALIREVRRLREKAGEAKPRCRAIWRAGVLRPVDGPYIPDRTRCSLEPHGDDVPHQFKGRDS